MYSLITGASLIICTILGYLIHVEVARDAEAEKNFRIMEMSRVELSLLERMGEDEFRKALREAFSVIAAELAAPKRYTKDDIQRLLREDRRLQALASKHADMYCDNLRLRAQNGGI